MTEFKSHTGPAPIPFALIGITGAARSGKDTLADFLCSTLGLYRLMFAGPIKSLVCHLLHCTLPELERMDKEAPHMAFGGKTIREVLQTLGTDWGRDTIWRDIWVEKMAWEIRIMRREHHFLSADGYGTPHRGMVITDVRFTNEAALIRAEGGKLIHLMRQNAPAVREHRSEKGVNYHPDDIVLHNNGTIEDLKKNTLKMLHGAGLSHLHCTCGSSRGRGAI